jgi:hypothetical protein
MDSSLEILAIQLTIYLAMLIEQAFRKKFRLYLKVYLFYPLTGSTVALLDRNLG